MIQHINKKGIINSIWLGMFIGLSLQIYIGQWQDMISVLISIIVSGVIGFVIGTMTEIVTVLLPITLANPKSYFAINNLIALMIAASIIAILQKLYPVDPKEVSFALLLMLILVIIAMANLLDYLYYLHTNKKLKKYKKKLRS